MNIETILSIIFVYCFLYKKNKREIIITIKSLITSIISNYLLLTDDKFFKIYDYKENEVNSLYLYPMKVFYCYIFFEIYDNLFQGRIDFTIHAILVSLSMILLKYYQLSHYLTIAVLMDTSSIFLVHVKKSLLYKILFVSTFFIYRILVFPLYSYTYFINKYDKIVTYDVNFHTFSMSIIFSISALNIYWFCKIIKIALKEFT